MVEPQGKAQKKLCCRESRRMREDSSWYLVRTKANRERYVERQLTRMVPEVFLPLLDNGRCSPRLRDSVVPLFPQYIFVRGDLSTHYFPIRYAPGVVSFVSTGVEPLPVPEGIIGSIRSRSTDGVVRLAPSPFRQGETVRVVGGAFRGFDAVFERYLSAGDRVSILLNAMEGYNVRLLERTSNVGR